jgi:hypothetical protein
MEKLAIRGGQPVRTKPFPTWPIFGREEEEALLRALRSGKWGRFAGNEVATFERRFADYRHAKHGIAVVNGTVSLRVALLAAGIEAGDEVIVPPYTFLATARRDSDAYCRKARMIDGRLDASPQMLTVQEPSANSRLSVATIHRLKGQGKIPFYQPAGKGGRLLFPADAIRRTVSETANPFSPPVDNRTHQDDRRGGHTRHRPWIAKPVEFVPVFVPVTGTNTKHLS